MTRKQRRVRGQSAAIAVLLGGCAYFGDGSDDGLDPPDATPPIDELPAGVWEPVPGASIRDASLAADNDTVWWVSTVRTSPAGEYLYKDDIWLSATSPKGNSVVAPAKVAPGSTSEFDPDVVVTPSAVIAKLGGLDTLLRRYDHTGVPLGDPYTLVIDQGGRQLSGFNQTDLVPTPNGGAQFVASLGNDMAEVAIVDLDAGGTPTATTFAGTPDTTEPGGSVAYGIAAAARPDGSTLVAWDRNYNGCISVRPSETWTTAVDGATVGATQAVHDIPDAGEARPSIAVSGSTAYIAWSSYATDRVRVGLAKFPDVTTALAEVGDPNESSTEASLTLVEPGRGAIVYTTGDWDTGRINVVAFEESAGSVLYGVRHVVPKVDPDASSSSVGLVHIGNHRYVIGWIEYGVEARLYATEIDLNEAMLRPAPAFDTRTATRPSRKLRCP